MLWWKKKAALRLVNLSRTFNIRGRRILIPGTSTHYCKYHCIVFVLNYISSSSIFSPFGVHASSFHCPCSSVLCFSLYSRLIRVFAYNITPPQFWYAYISMHIILGIFRVAYFYIHCIGKIRHILGRKTTEIMVNAYVTSRLDHGNGLLYGVSDHLLTQLQRVQNSAARLVTKTKRRECITPALIKLHWLPVRQRIEYKLLLLTFNSLHGLAAPYLAELLSRHQPTRSLRSADAHLLVVPRRNLSTQGYRAFSHAAPRLWNNLPLAMRITDSQNIFKKQLKTLLFKRAFSL